MDVFKLHHDVLQDYFDYVRSFIKIKDKRLEEYVLQELQRGKLWPEPRLQLNPPYQEAKNIGQLVDDGTLHMTGSATVKSVSPRPHGRNPPMRACPHRLSRDTYSQDSGRHNLLC